MDFLFRLILWAFVISLFFGKAAAHDVPGIPKEHQAWYQNAELTPLAKKRLNYHKCCNHAEVFRTKFRVNKADGGDEWYYYIAGDWKRIPADIVHPHDVHAPDGQPTLFIFQGTLTCFFIGQGGL